MELIATIASTSLLMSLLVLLTHVVDREAKEARKFAAAVGTSMRDLEQRVEALEITGLAAAREGYVVVHNVPPPPEFMTNLTVEDGKIVVKGAE